MAHVQRSTWAFAFVGCTVAAGCAAIAGIEDTTTIRGDAGRPDATVPVNDAGEAGADGSTIEEIADAAEPVVDASLCADAAARVRGASAVEVKTSTGVICPDPVRILDIDDKGVGLDSTGVTPATRWIDQIGNDRAVHGCVGVQFDGPITAVLLRARMMGQGCNTNCDAVDGCNTYRYAGVWRRQSDGGMWLIGTPPLDREVFEDKVLLVDDGGTVEDPFIVVCRTSMADRRDDVDVDYLGGCR